VIHVGKAIGPKDASVSTSVLLAVDGIAIDTADLANKVNGHIGAPS
jgi:hypothetical protein